MSRSRDLNCSLKICSTRVRSIVVGCSGAIIMHLATCLNKFRNIGGNN